MQHYRNTLLFLGIIFVGGLLADCSLVGYCGQLRGRLELASKSARAARQESALARNAEISREEKIRPLRNFSKAWEAQMPNCSAKELGNTLRNGLTTLATRASLTSEGATVSAEPHPYPIAGHVVPVQEVSLTVVGDSLPAIVAWLGSVEETYAYGRIENLALSAYGSRSVQLNIRLFFPITEIGQRASAGGNLAAVTRS
jgi:hypothetical protein